jgi:hypothetical protein
VRAPVVGAVCSYPWVQRRLIFPYRIGCAAEDDLEVSTTRDSGASPTDGSVGCPESLLKPLHKGQLSVSACRLVRSDANWHVYTSMIWSRRGCALNIRAYVIQCVVVGMLLHRQL